LLAAPLLAEEATGISALGVDPGALLVYLVNFGVLLLILYLFGYKRILGMMDQRSIRIKESLEEADRVRAESEQRHSEMQKSLTEARQEGQQMLAEAREAADRYRKTQEDQARAEAQQIVERAREEILHERDSALEQVRSEFASLALTAAERIINRSLDPDVHRDLIEDVLTESESRNNQN
jgi:F-type H+-transporting ATPase subunit b